MPYVVQNSEPFDVRMPFLFVFLFTAVPFVLQIVGIDLGTSLPANMGEIVEQAQSLGDILGYLKGYFVHTLLEWTAVCISLVTLALAWLYYRGQQENFSGAIIAMAVMTSGLMDAYHTLASDHLVVSVTTPEKFIPFTWALSRMFNALIIQLGILYLLYHKYLSKTPPKPLTLRILGVSFLMLAFFSMYITKSSELLPQVSFPNAILFRPWDGVALLFYIVSVFVYYKFFENYRGWFSLMLLLSLIPNIVAQLVMCFASNELFDHSFNTAHYLKIVAYSCPLMGLVVEFHQGACLPQKEGP